MPATMLWLDHEAFLLLNAEEDTENWLVNACRFLAVHAHWLVVFVFARGLRCWKDMWRPIAGATLAIALASLACELIGSAWDRPRPFELGLGTLHSAHSGSPSFPSSHSTVYGALAVLVGAARVVVGVHYPLDIGIGIAIGAGTALTGHAAISRAYSEEVA